MQGLSDQDATAQQIGGFSREILGLFAVLSKNGGPDEPEVEAKRNQRMGQHFDVFIIGWTALPVRPYPLRNQASPCGQIFSEKLSQSRLQDCTGERHMKELTLFPDMVELPVHQFSDFCLQGCAGGAFDCSGTVPGYMKFHDVEEQSGLSPKISVDQAFGTSRARRDLTRCGCFVSPAGKEAGCG